MLENNKKVDISACLWVLTEDLAEVLSISMSTEDNSHYLFSDYLIF